MLVARRLEDLSPGRPDYEVYAGEVLIGRIYRTHQADGAWFWGVNAVAYDMTIQVQMHGQAPNFEDAKSNVRRAFDKWLAWASEMPPTDKKFVWLDEELKRLGIR